jgi:amino acid transporter
LGLVRLFTLDVLLSGSSLILDFAALVALRIKEPNLQRPFRVPGGMVGATLIGVCPTLLLTLSAVHSGSERIGSLRGLLFRTLLIVAGFLVYWGMSAAR